MVSRSFESKSFCACRGGNVTSLVEFCNATTEPNLPYGVLLFLNRYSSLFRESPFERFKEVNATSPCREDGDPFHLLFQFSCIASLSLYGWPDLYLRHFTRFQCRDRCSACSICSKSSVSLSRRLVTLRHQACFAALLVCFITFLHAGRQGRYMLSLIASLYFFLCIIFFAALLLSS